MMRGHTPSQYYSLMSTYNEVVKLKEKEPNIKITFTGHSLLGSTSQLASITTGEDAVTFAAFGAEGLLPKGVKKVSSIIVNYGNEDDDIFVSRINQHIGEVRIINRSNNKSPHKLENWGDLNEYIPYTKSSNPHVTNEEIESIKAKRYYLNKVKESGKEKTTGYASDIRNYSGSEKFSETIYPSDIRCAGTYSVSGYTRDDGTKVSAYTRTCGAKHNRKR